MEVDGCGGFMACLMGVKLIWGIDLDVCDGSGREGEEG